MECLCLLLEQAADSAPRGLGSPSSAEARRGYSGPGNETGNLGKQDGGGEETAPSQELPGLVVGRSHRLLSLLRSCGFY